MLDFVSTRQTTDPQSAACARLLAAVIAQAIQDACTPLNKDERDQWKNTNPDAREAIQFLFGSNSVFPLYARLIGSSADSIRRALLTREWDADRKMSRQLERRGQGVLTARVNMDRDAAACADALIAL